MHIDIADTWIKRLRGLLGKPLDWDRALMLKPCSSVHTFGMRYAIDIYYFNEQHECVHMVHGLRPMRVSACSKAHYVIEIASGHCYSDKEVVTYVYRYGYLNRL